MVGTGKIIEKIGNQHHIQVEVSLCSCFRTPKSDCSRCVDLCPVEAISISDGRPVITGGCTDCGICLSVCPNGVFSTDERNDGKIILEIRETVKRKKEDNFSITCVRGDRNSDLILPCLSRLTEPLLLEPLRAGMSAVELLKPACQDCPESRAASNIDSVVGHTLNLYEMTGYERNRLQVKDVLLQGLINLPEKTVSRRELFTAIRAKAAGVVAESLPEAGGNGEKDTVIFRDVLQNRHENAKRGLLLDSLRALPSVKTVNVAQKNALISEIEVNSRCTGCGTCLTLCPAGAIILKETENSFYLGFRPDLCTNCDVCLKTCMHGAIEFKETVTLNHLIEQKELKLFEAGKRVCPVCKTDYLDTGPEFCPLCIERSKKQQSLIKNMLIKEGGLI